MNYNHDDTTNASYKAPIALIIILPMVYPFTVDLICIGPCNMPSHKIRFDTFFCVILLTSFQSKIIVINLPK